MSKRVSLLRYRLIINKLRRKPSTFREIAGYLATESEIQGYDFSISKRTFKRDLDDIRSIFSIDIQFDFSQNVYRIVYDHPIEANDRVFEALDIFNALSVKERLSDYIHFEKRKPAGTENLYGLLHAIRNKVQISFDYRKFYDEQSTRRRAEPYALKEFKNRWYVLANDLKDDQIKVFGLDRLSNLDITRRPFQSPKAFDVAGHYRHCFGIITPDNGQPEEVILSFDHHQGQYIKSLPLHASQEVLLDNKEELRIKLHIYITYDFVMELLSYGDRVRVVEPEGLVKEIKGVYERVVNYY